MFTDNKFVFVTSVTMQRNVRLQLLANDLLHVGYISDAGQPLEKLDCQAWFYRRLRFKPGY